MLGRAGHPGVGNPFPSALADRCVMCGMCLTVCPTYGKTRDEAESPRGRIALMRAFTEGRLAPTEQALGHLDRCLACRACEAICPADVPYGELLDAARAVLEPQRRRPRVAGVLRRLGLALVAGDSSALRRVGRWLKRYQRLGLQRLARRSGVLGLLGVAPMEALLPTLGEPYRGWGYYPACGSERGRVALFVGCVAQILDAGTLGATVYVLRRIGFGVYVPRDQGCCGALHRHGGEARSARQLAERNLRAFAELPVEAIIGTASGCTAVLAGYGEAGDGLPRWKVSVVDVSQFLARHWPGHLALSPLPRRVAVHVPCSLANALHAGAAPAALLSRIPEVELAGLPQRPACCGAAGDYMLREVSMAQALRDDLLAAVDADYLASSNIGCALHLAAGLRALGRLTEVLHPVALLARQMGWPGP
jgi:glycolate oxidase iron-sulfur subunit